MGTPYSKAFNDYIVNLYSSGKTGEETAKISGCSESHVFRVLKQRDIPTRPMAPRKIYSREFNNKLVRLYKSGGSLQEVADKLGCSKTHIRRTLQEKGVPRRLSGNRKWFYSSQIAQKTPHTAYWAGVLAADGCIVQRNCSRRTQRRVILRSKDKRWLRKFQHFMGAETLKLSHRGNCSYIGLSSDKLADDLSQWNVTPRKSLTLYPPKNISDSLLPHYIRGVFDGDGGVYNLSIAKRLVPIPSCKAEITTASENFGRWIVTTCVGNPCIYKDDRKKNPCFSIRWGGFSDTMTFCNWIYQDATHNIMLDRKYNVFQELKVISILGKARSNKERRYE